MIEGLGIGEDLTPAERKVAQVADLPRGWRSAEAEALTTSILRASNET
jgi:hypothetical protein